MAPWRHLKTHDQEKPVREEGHRLFITAWIGSLAVFGVRWVIISDISRFTTLFVVFMQLKNVKSSPGSADWIHRNWWRFFFCLFVWFFFFVKAAELPFKVPSAPPRLRLPLSKTAVPVATSCRCHTPAAWWTCKQHGHSYIFPSGRLGAVSTILFTLWIPRTRSRPAPLF